MRGKAQDLTDRQPVCWITPACAGKSTSGMLFLSCSWDHPRMCGEKITLLYALADKEGSPPHVRGKVDKSTYRNLQNRITPACAGKSLTATRAARSTGDHPRMCGEKPDCKAKRNPKKGSPPHVRGKEIGDPASCKPSRITPACAGKSFEEHGFVIGVWDHPRMCGEKLTTFDAGKLIPGSPPHVRGKAAVYAEPFTGSRITPACAGKRLRLTGICLLLWDHPRMCGEKPKKIP